MKKYKTLMVITYFLLVACGFTADYFYENIPEVTLTKAQVGRVVDSVSYTGTVRAREVGVFSPAAFRVVNVYVEDGQYVKQGDLLASLDMNDVGADHVWRQMQGRLANGIVDEDFLAEIWSVAQGANGYEVIMASGSALRAPIDGYVTVVSIQEGEYADILSPLFRITDRNQMNVNVQVPESRISEILPGQAVSITGSGFGGQTYYGHVEKIADQASQSLLNNDGAKIPVTISLNHPDGKLMSGFTATVTIRLRTRDSVVKIPLELIDQDQNGKEYVWIYENGTAYRKYIDCRYTSYGYAEVVGFDAAQWIIGQTDDLLRDGTAVHLSGEWYS
jgi:multidrug efflux pump subunit AcrA (membrane-fusion protein)